MNRGRFARRNLPELRKSAEMIEPDVVKIARQPAHAVDPPRVSLLLHHVPAIKRIAPALAVFAEKIRRHAGNDFGIERGVQTKQIGMRPNIGAIEIHKDRDVAHYANRLLRAISSQRLPLLVEKKLHRAAHVEFVMHFGLRLGDRDRIAVNKFARPMVPAFKLETRAQSIEKDEVIEPCLILPAKIFKTPACRRSGGAHESGEPPRTTKAAYDGKPRIIHGPTAIGYSIDRCAVDPATIGETLQANQQRITSEGGSRRIGRVPEA